MMVPTIRMTRTLTSAAASGGGRRCVLALTGAESESEAEAGLHMAAAHEQQRYTPYMTSTSALAHAFGNNNTSDSARSLRVSTHSSTSASSPFAQLMSCSSDTLQRRYLQHSSAPARQSPSSAEPKADTADMPPPFIEQLTAAIREHRQNGNEAVNDNDILSTNYSLRYRHATDEGLTTIIDIDDNSASASEHASNAQSPTLPDCVVYPRSTAEVSLILSLCNTHLVPVVPFGAGSSLEGHITPLKNTNSSNNVNDDSDKQEQYHHSQLRVCLDMSQMNAVLEVNHEDSDCFVESGVTLSQLDGELRHSGLFFSVDPGADATIGGMTACRASGTTAVRYGTMRENVLGLTAVLADGSIVHCGGIHTRSKKRSNGYDLTALMIGSEGTLGVITEVRLKLQPVPDQVATATCSFDSLHDAVQSVIDTMQMGLPVTKIELMDDAQVKAINNYCGFSMPEKPTLLYEFSGIGLESDESSTSSSSSSPVSEAVSSIAMSNNGNGFEYVTSADDRKRLWTARKNAYYAARSVRTGPRMLSFSTDVCVPISHLASSIVETKEDLIKYNIIAPIVGHVGDGNYHCLVQVNLDDDDEMRRVEEVFENMVKRAIACGGTCSGEHGIGRGKLKYLKIEHGEGGIQVMHTIKKALDKNNILNPGKMGSDLSRLL